MKDQPDVCADVCRTRLVAAQRRSMSRRPVCAGLRAHSRPALTSSSPLPSPLPSRLSRSATTGTQFTCFTRTKVQILTQLRQAHPCHGADYCRGGGDFGVEQTAIYVSSCCYLCVLMLLFMRPHAAICVLVLLYMCPRASIYVSQHI